MTTGVIGSSPAGLVSTSARATAEGPGHLPTVVAVGLGQARAIGPSSPGNTEYLAAFGLGSCVALCLMDPTTRVAGLAHIVLPGDDPQGQPNAKFALSAVPALVHRMQAIGAGDDPRRYHVRLAGGAQVLHIGGTGSLPRIGDRNGAAIQLALAQRGMLVLATDLGGTRGRSVRFNPQEGGRIRIAIVGQAERVL